MNKRSHLLTVWGSGDIGLAVARKFLSLERTQPSSCTKSLRFGLMCKMEQGIWKLLGTKVF